MTKIKREEELRQIIEDTIWMAIRYAHGRHTYAPSMVRNAIEKMREVFPDWRPKPDKVIETPSKKDVGGMSFRKDYLDDIFKL